MHDNSEKVNSTDEINAHDSCSMVGPLWRRSFVLPNSFYTSKRGPKNSVSVIATEIYISTKIE